MNGDQTSGPNQPTPAYAGRFCALPKSGLRHYWVAHPIDTGPSCPGWTEFRARAEALPASPALADVAESVRFSDQDTGLPFRHARRPPAAAEDWRRAAYSAALLVRRQGSFQDAEESPEEYQPRWRQEVYRTDQPGDADFAAGLFATYLLCSKHPDPAVEQHLIDLLSSPRLFGERLLYSITWYLGLAGQVKRWWAPFLLKGLRKALGLCATPHLPAEPVPVGVTPLLLERLLVDGRPEPLEAFIATVDETAFPQARDQTFGCKIDLLDGLFGIGTGPFRARMKLLYCLMHGPAAFPQFFTCRSEGEITSIFAEDLQRFSPEHHELASRLLADA